MYKYLASSYTVEQLTTMRDNALSAMHQLMIGEKGVEVFVIDRKVKYEPTNMDALGKWVETLSQAIDYLNGSYAPVNCPINVLAAV